MASRNADLSRYYVYFWRKCDIYNTAAVVQGAFIVLFEHTQRLDPASYTETGPRITSKWWILQLLSLKPRYVIWNDIIHPTIPIWTGAVCVTSIRGLFPFVWRYSCIPGGSFSHPKGKGWHNFDEINVGWSSWLSLIPREWIVIWHLESLISWLYMFTFSVNVKKLF